MSATLLNTHPYPITCLEGLSIAALCRLFAGPQRRMQIWFAISPDYRVAWTPGSSTNRALLGVPAGGHLWWAAVGAVHPRVMAHCAGVVRRASAAGMPASQLGPQ